MQERLIKGTAFVHETMGYYKTIEELWDGELWAEIGLKEEVVIVLDIVLNYTWNKFKSMKRGFCCCLKFESWGRIY